MSRRWLVGLALGIAILALSGWLWNRAGDRVLAEARAPSGRGAIIRVREIQPAATASLGGLLLGILGVGERAYRCEYYPGEDSMMFSCETFAGESTWVRKVEIKWSDDRTAKVTLDGRIAFECVDGSWGRTKP